MPGTWPQRLALGTAWIMFLFVLTTSMVGVVKNYSPVPFWDMWDGYLGFFTQVEAGVASAWWAQHAEHRLLVGNAFFWLDLKYFNGTTVLLFTLNCVLAFAIASLLALCVKGTLDSNDAKTTRDITILSVFSLMLSWTQEGNLTWAFQASFFPSLLLPLLSLFVLSLSIASGRLWIFLTALALGVLSAGTMANGLATLPIMAFTAYALGARKWRILALLIAWVAVAALYFHGYKSPELNGSIVDSLMHSKLDMARYLLIYLGGIFNYMFEGGNRLAAEIAGFISLVLFGVAAYQIVFRSQQKRLNYLLLGFAAYLLLSGCATAGGRLKFGLDQALSSRYMTYSLAYWSTLTIMLVSVYKPSFQKRWYLALLTMIVPLLLVPYQMNALKATSDRNYNRLLAGLAMEMGVRDSTQIMNIFPWLDVGFILAERPRQMNLSFFGNPLVADTHEKIGQDFRPSAFGLCKGNLDSTVAIPEDSEYVKVTGWISSNASGKQPESVAFVDTSNRLVGYGLTRAAVTGIFVDSDGLENVPITFVGYLNKSGLDTGLLIYGQAPNCLVASAPVGKVFKASLPSGLGN